MAEDDFEEGLEEYDEQDESDFPFERVETTGAGALAEWRRLQSPEIAPVIVGDDSDFERLEADFDGGASSRSLDEILEEAADLDYPELLVSLREEPRFDAEDGELTAWDIAHASLAATGGEAVPPEVAAAISALLVRLKELLAEPDDEAPVTGPSLVVDSKTQKPIRKANILLIPTDDWTTIPARLNWGGWNDCPDPEYHVAALRNWRDRFGAELIALGPDVLEIRVTNRPETPEAALNLAFEHYLYAPDIVDQGVGDLALLARALFEDDWWFFWWD